MTQEIYLSSQFVIHHCVNCNVAYAVTSQFYEERMNDHKPFHCPNGHKQWYTKESDEDKLRDQLKHCRADRDFWVEAHEGAQKRENVARRSRAAFKGVVTKLKKEKT